MVSAVAATVRGASISFLTVSWPHPPEAEEVHTGVEWSLIESIETVLLTIEGHYTTESRF